MPPIQLSGQTPPAGPPPANHGTHTWRSLRLRANAIGSIVALFLFIALIGSTIGYFIAQAHKPNASAKTPSVQNLTPAEIQQLSNLGTGLGTTNQILNIGADALFRGNANVVGTLTVGGHLDANGPVTLSQLDITGTTALSGLNVGSNLNVTGTTTLQKALTVNSLTTINGALTVSGQLSVGSIDTSSLVVNTISITGPLTIGHLKTNGPTPFYALGAVGSGGTVSISGDDTAGTININVGTNPSANATLMSVTFRVAYAITPHVLLSPRSADAAKAEAYVFPSPTGFSVLTANTPSGNLSYDYFVTQ